MEKSFEETQRTIRLHIRKWLNEKDVSEVYASIHIFRKSSAYVNNMLCPRRNIGTAAFSHLSRFITFPPGLAERVQCDEQMRRGKSGRKRRKTMAPGRSRPKDWQDYVREIIAAKPLLHRPWRKAA